MPSLRTEHPRTAFLSYDFIAAFICRVSFAYRYFTFNVRTFNAMLHQHALLLRLAPFDAKKRTPENYVGPRCRVPPLPKVPEMVLTETFLFALWCQRYARTDYDERKVNKVASETLPFEPWISQRSLFLYCLFFNAPTSPSGLDHFDSWTELSDVVWSPECFVCAERKFTAGR